MSAPTVTPQDQARGLKVLVVDDCPDTAASLATLLLFWGHEPRTAGDGRKALAVVPDFQPDVALLDLGLPGMDGYELARCLHRLPGFAMMPLIALTGYADTAHRERSMEAGFSTFAVKPVDPMELQALLGLLERERSKHAHAEFA
jgi:CheY-like chemotaxis protein